MEKINWKETMLPDTNPDVRLLVPEKNKAPNGRAILVLPGGGYFTFSNSDRNIIPMWYQEHGYTCFVLLYSVREYAHYPAPLLDASKAVWYIRSHAEEYGIDPDQIIVMGFSAGAHVAAMLAAAWHKEFSTKGTDIPYGGNRPNATVTGFTPTEFESFYEKNGADAKGPEMVMNENDEVFRDITSLTATNYISELTPPAFLWKTSADVPESTTEYYRMCKKYHVPCEIHIFTDPNRCFGMHFDQELYPDDDVSKYSLNTAMWPQMSLNWLDMIFAGKGE